MKAGDIIQGQGSRQYRVLKILRNGYIEATPLHIVVLRRPEQFRVVETADSRNGRVTR